MKKYDVVWAPLRAQVAPAPSFTRGAGETRAQAKPANGIAHGAPSTIRHVSAPAGRGRWTRQRGTSVDGPVSTQDHEGLGYGSRG